MSNKSLPEYLQLAKDWLKAAHPTETWTTLFIKEVYLGKHTTDPRHAKVLLALSKAGLIYNHKLP